MSAMPKLAALVDLLTYAEQNAPRNVALQHFPAMIAKLRRAKDPHRVNGSDSGQRPPGVAILRLPDEAIRNLKSDEPDTWILVRVRRSVVDRHASPIVLPGERRPS